MHIEDAKTQKFLKERWETKIGRLVLKDLVKGIKKDDDLSLILEEHLQINDDFWVSNNNDLRGIYIFDQDFTKSTSLAKKDLEYSNFFKCKLHKVDFQYTDLSHSAFEMCDMTDVQFASAIILRTKFKSCLLKNANFSYSTIKESLFHSSDLRGGYFTECTLKDLDLNYLTRFDIKLKMIPNRFRFEQLADIYKAIRIGYEKAEIWSQMDLFLYQEKKAERKYILWPNFLKSISFYNLKILMSSCISNILSGYSTMPFRVILNAIGVILFFSSCYFLLGLPISDSSIPINLINSINLSIASFTGFMFSDLTYGPNYPLMRFLCMAESIMGTVFISLFVVVLVRKIFRNLL